MVRKKNGAPGNTLRDRQWLREHAESLVRTPEDGEYDGLLMWDGTEETKGSAWNIPPAEGRCTVMAYIRDDDGRYVIDSTGKRMWRPCYAWRIKGSNVCLAHGGGTDAARAKAQERLVSAADYVVGQMLAIADDRKNPPAVRLKAMQSVLDRAGVAGHVDLTVRAQAGYEKVWDEMQKFGKSIISQDDDEGD